MGKIKCVIALFLVVLLSGCGCKSEEIVFYGKSEFVFDNTNIQAPTGYFMGGYYWVDVDENTKEQPNTKSKNKKDGNFLVCRL